MIHGLKNMKKTKMCCQFNQTEIKKHFDVLAYDMFDIDEISFV